MEHDIDNLDLPKSSRNQELEILSKKAFESLFDVERFILQETIIDNGIDYRCELKRNGTVLGFNFNFQLKSKEEASPNTDGSYSKSLETSNVNYLINNGVPGFYGFYVEENQTFFYEFLDDFISDLHQKNSAWDKQPNHTLRFSKKLDNSAVDDIYNIVMSRGISFRAINSKLAIKSIYLETDRIHIDYTGKVTTDDEIRNIIEGIGLELINRGEWIKITELHGKASNDIKVSAKYYLVLGLTNYYLGHFYTSLDFFRKAKKDIFNLAPELQNHLNFIDVSIKHMMGILTTEDFESEISKIPADNHIHYHIKIDSAITILKDNLFSEASAFEEFKINIAKIVDDQNASPHVKIRAKSELLFYRYKVALNSYLVNICRINAHEEMFAPNLALRESTVAPLQEEFRIINDGIQSLLRDSRELNNFSSFYYILTNKIKLDFEKFVDFELFKVVKKPLPIIGDFTEIYQELLEHLENCISYFNRVGHTENILFSKIIKYEIYDYLGYANSKIILKEVEDVVNYLDVKEFREKLEFLKSSGTNHQMLNNLLNDMDQKSAEQERMKSELQDMDRQESSVKISLINTHQIDLFPIGMFLIPKEKIDTFFSMLSIEDEVRTQFNWFFEMGIVPKINTYVFPVKEGPLEGFIECKGHENFKNMYNIRKLCFENKFYRIPPKH